MFSQVSVAAQRPKVTDTKASSSYRCGAAADAPYVTVKCLASDHRVEAEFAAYGRSADKLVYSCTRAHSQDHLPVSSLELPESVAGDGDYARHE